MSATEREILPIVAAALLAAGAASCNEIAGEIDRLTRPAAPPGPGAQTPKKDAEPLTGAGRFAFNPPPSFAPIYRAAAPSVVNISAMSDTGKSLGEGLRRFYEAFGVRIPHERFTQSRGTGFVVDADGRVATNHHLIDGSADIVVRYIDGTERPARFLRADEGADLALLDVENPPARKALPLGDSDALEQGEWVLAIGNAVGLGHTATAGIVSAKGREMAGGAPRSAIDHLTGRRGAFTTGLIQIDASINDGTSGGPLLDANAKVVGVNVFLGEEGQGIGFAIPAAALRAFLGAGDSGTAAGEDMSAGDEDEDARQDYLGLRMIEITAQNRARLGTASAAGVYVFGVDPAGPAHKAGIREGDVIESYDGRPARRPTPFAEYVLAAKNPVRLYLRRDGAGLFVILRK